MWWGYSKHANQFLHCHFKMPNMNTVNPNEKRRDDHWTDFLSWGHEVQHGHTERGTMLETEVCFYTDHHSVQCVDTVYVCMSVASGLPLCYVWLHVGHSWYPVILPFSLRSHEQTWQTSLCYLLQSKLVHLSHKKVKGIWNPSTKEVDKEFKLVRKKS